MPTLNDSIPVIEFVGLPGSGKTTLLKALLVSPNLEAHDLVGAVLLERGNLMWKMLAATTRILPRTRSRALRKHLALTLSPSLTELDQSWEEALEQAQNVRSRFLIGQTLRMYAAIHHTSQDVLVEEGVLQRLYSADPGRNPTVAFLASPRVRAVVYLNTHPEIAMTRLLQRMQESGSWGVRRFRGHSEAEVFRDLMRNYAFNGMGIASLAESHQVVELDGAGSPHEVLQAAERSLRAIR